MKLQLTDQITQFILKHRYELIPDIVLKRAKLAIVDSLGVMLAGAQHQPIAIALKYIQQQGGSPKCSVIGHAYQTSPVQAAFINAMSCHVLDFEIMWNPPGHPCSPILPALFAISELKKVSGKSFISAFVVGLEIFGRLRFLQGTKLPLIFHPQAIEGLMSCVAASSCLMRLKELPIKYAFGIGASRCGGLLANAGTMTKCMHSGVSAGFGLESVFLAKMGFTANIEIFDHPAGFIYAFFPSIKSQSLSDLFDHPLGQPYYLENQDFAIKKYPCQYGTHFAIDAALKLRLEHSIDWKKIAFIELEYPLMNYINRSRVDNSLAGKFSLQFLLASAFIDGTITEQSFSKYNIRRNSIQKLMRQVKIYFNDKIKPSFADMYGILSVTLRNGKTYTQRCDKPLGHWDNPIDETFIFEKMYMNLKPFLTKKQIELLIDEILNFEYCHDASEILNILNGESK